MREATEAIFCLNFSKQSIDGNGDETMREPANVRGRIMV